MKWFLTLAKLVCRVKHLFFSKLFLIK